MSDCVEVIRCKDCKYYRAGDCVNDIWTVCHCAGFPYVDWKGFGDGFCAWAERNDENEL